MLAYSSLLKINIRYSKFCLVNQYSQYLLVSSEIYTHPKRISMKSVLSQESYCESTALIRNTSCSTRGILLWTLANHFRTQPVNGTYDYVYLVCLCANIFDLLTLKTKVLNPLNKYLLEVVLA